MTMSLLKQSTALSQGFHRAAWARVAGALAIVATAWIVWAPTIAQIFAPVGDVSVSIDEDFDNGALVSRQALTVEGFHACQYGWCLAPKTSGSLIYRFLAQHESPSISLWFLLPQPGTNRLSVSTDGGATYHVAFENAHSVAAAVDLGIRVRPGDEVWLKFDTTNESQRGVLALDKCTVIHRPGPVPVLPSARLVFAVVVWFGLAVVLLCRDRLMALSTLGILALGAALRYDSALSYLNFPLDPDAIIYRRLMDIMKPFTDSGFYSARFGMREPLFMFVMWMYDHWVVGLTAFGQRLMNVMLSTAAIWCILRVGRALLGRVSGQVIGLAIAANAVLIAEAPRALRLELELILCQAFFWLAFVKPLRRPARAAAAMAVVGGLLTLTRSTYLPVVLVLSALALYRPGRRPWATWIVGNVIVVTVVVAMVAPHRYNMYRIHGDAFYDTSQYARWNANMEFAGRPGFLTMAELQANAFVGPRISYGEYMWGLHSRSDVFRGTISGHWKLFRRMEVCSGAAFGLGDRCTTVNDAFQVLAVVGLAIAVGVARYRWIPLAFMLLAFPVAFLYDRGLVESYRHTYHAFPLLLFCAALTLVTGWRMLSRWRRPSAAPECVPVPTGRSA